MSLKTNNNFSNPSLNTTQNGKIELFEIRNFQLSKNVCISAKEMQILPVDYKNDLRKIFLKIINKSEVKNEIRQKDATSISLKVIDNKLVYKLDGSKEYKTIQDAKVQKAFQKIAKNIKKYLRNTGTLKEKQISKVDKCIISTSPSNVEKVSKEVFKKFKKSDAEWKLWVIWGNEIKSAIEKIFKVFNLEGSFFTTWINEIKSAIEKIFKFSNSKNLFFTNDIGDVLGYLFGLYGIFNGMEIERDSRKIKDIEGQKDGRHKIYRNILTVLGGTIEIVTENLSKVTFTLLKTILNTLASFIFILVAICSTLKYAYFAMKANLFKCKYTRYTENEKLDEVKKMLSVLRFFKNKITVTNEEARKIIKKIRKQNPISTDYKLKKTFHKEITKKLLSKIKRFERRVGSGVVSTIQQNVDEILKDPTNEKNIEKAKKILNEIKNKNNWNITENKWYAIAAILQGLEIVLVVVLGSSALTAVVGSFSSAVIVIMFSIYFYKKYFLKEKEKCKLDENLDLLADPS